MILELADILKILPHRPPFLFVDRVKDLVPGHSGMGIKLVTIDEPLLVGNQPRQPALPGVMALEIMAQTAAVICGAAAAEQQEGAGGAPPGSGYLVSAESQFFAAAHPGDILETGVTIIKAWGRFIMAKGEARAHDKLVATGRFTLASM